MWLRDDNYHFAIEKIKLDTSIDFPAAAPNVMIQFYLTDILI